LRYPGGKRKLANFVSLLLRTNRLLDGDYAEVFAGGSAVALSLLFGEYVRRIHINDLDRGVHAFWRSALRNTDDLCRRIERAPLSIREWKRQRAIQLQKDPDPLDLGFSTLYLNRTNRSGIVLGGPIGGAEQHGTWGIDARFNRTGLVHRIRLIGRWASRIELYNLDGARFLKDVAPGLPKCSLLYLDPPYFVKGQERLYANYYEDSDHAVIAKAIQRLRRPWIVSYDDVTAVKGLYRERQSIHYRIPYTAQVRYQGREVLFFSDKLTVPAVRSPIFLTPREFLAPTG
jgi:DNA adenine methylase